MTRKQIKELLEEYKVDYDMMTEESDEMLMMMAVIDDVLTPAEKIILLEYAELSSVRKLGKELNVSQSTAYNVIRKLQEKVKDGIAEYYDDRGNLLFCY